MMHTRILFRSFSVVLLLGLFVCLPLSLTAEEASAVVIFAEGEGFEVVRGEEELAYDLQTTQVEGLELVAGDYITTYDGTFLEIQLFPSQSVVKVSENTSFAVNAVGESGGGFFALTYGRLRARVKRLFGGDAFEISGPSVVAGVRGTDFGYDRVLDIENTAKTKSKVYCFDGVVEVTAVDTAEKMADGGKDTDQEAVQKEQPHEAESEASDSVEISSAETPQSVVIYANQMVEVEETPLTEPDQDEESGDGRAVAGPASPAAGGEKYRITLVKQDIPDEIETYWEANTFQGRLLNPEQQEEESASEETSQAEAESTPPVEEVIAEDAEEMQKQKEKKRRVYIGSSIALFSAGAVMEAAGIITGFGVSSWVTGANTDVMRPLGLTLMGAGGAVFVSGLIPLIAGLVTANAE